MLLISYLTYFTFTFNHLADAFIQSEDNRSNKNQQKSNNMQVLWQVSVSLTPVQVFFF